MNMRKAVLMIMMCGICLSIPFQSAGGLRFNGGSARSPSDDKKAVIYELLDHMAQHYALDSASKINLPVFGYKSMNSELKVNRIGKIKELCQTTFCKIGNGMKLVDVSLDLKKVSIFSGPIETSAFDDGCLELTMYDENEPGKSVQGKDMFTSAFISGQLSHSSNQARTFKVLFSRVMKEYLPQVADYRDDQCSTMLLKKFIYTELATFSQGFLQKNFENRIRMKIAVLQARIEKQKKSKQNSKTTRPKTPVIFNQTSHGIYIKTPLSTLKPAITSKLQNHRLTNNIISHASVSHSHPASAQRPDKDVQVDSGVVVDGQGYRIAGVRQTMQVVVCSSRDE